MQGLLNSQEGQRSKKRKSPRVTMPLFKSPLSRMLLSPRIRSPSMRHTSQTEIELVHNNIEMGQYSVDVG
jgi:hypothetical protein